MNPKWKTNRFFCRRFFLLILTVGMISFVEAKQLLPNTSDSIIVLSGKFYGKNLNVFQPQVSSTKIVRVNGKEMNDSVFKRSAYTIDLKSFLFNEGQDIKVEIVYNLDKKAPKVMNPGVLMINPLLNAKLPPLIGKDITGKEINTSAMIGKVVVINTWFVGCKPCVNEMPALNNLVKQFGNKNVVFLAPSLTSEEKIKEFLVDHSFNYSIIANSLEYCNVLKCEGYPYNIVVNKKGIVTYVELGAQQDIETVLNAQIEKALKENN